jgi:hypothetical protein
LAVVAAILARLFRLVSREMKSYGAIAGNNVLLFAIAGGGVFPLLVVGIFLLIPMSSGPLKKIPPDRLALWPITPRQKAAIEILSVWLSPVPWLILFLLIYSKFRLVGLLLLPFLAIVQTIGTIMGPERSPLKFIPRLPTKAGELIRKDLRQLLSFLDPYFLLCLSLGTAAYLNFAENPDTDAGTVMAVFMASTFGTAAQCLFGLDGPGGYTRYKLLPLKGWQILGAKGAAWLIILMILLAPLNKTAGLAAGLIALAVGHNQAIKNPKPQTKWRLTSGDIYPFGLLQSALSIGIGMQANKTLYALPAAAIIYLISLAFYGHKWQKVSLQ